MKYRILLQNLNIKAFMKAQLTRQTQIHSPIHYKHPPTHIPNQPQLGKLKLLLTDTRKGTPLITVGPNYFIFSLAFLSVNIFTIYFLYRLSLAQDTNSFFLILSLVTIFLDIFWLATGLINPGVATSGEEEEGEVCQPCLRNNNMKIMVKNERTHCVQCDICIDGHQTHLKMVGCCIGKNNFIPFRVLLLGIFLWGLSMITIVPLTYHL